MPRYPNIVCGIGRSGPGNIFAIVGRIRGEMKRARIPAAEIDRFSAEVRDTPSYADALRVCGEWVTMPEQQDR